MSTQTSGKKASLVCGYEAAKAARDLYPDRHGVELVVTGVNLQRDHVLEHLSARLQELQARLAEMNEVKAPELVTMRSFLRGRLEGQIELLQELIAKLR